MKQIRIIRKALKNVNNTYIDVQDENSRDEEEDKEPPKNSVFNQMLKRPLV